MLNPVFPEGPGDPLSIRGGVTRLARYPTKGLFIAIIPCNFHWFSRLEHRVETWVESRRAAWCTVNRTNIKVNGDAFITCAMVKRYLCLGLAGMVTTGLPGFNITLLAHLRCVSLGRGFQGLLFPVSTSPSSNYP